MAWPKSNKKTKQKTVLGLVCSPWLVGAGSGGGHSPETSLAGTSTSAPVCSKFFFFKAWRAQEHRRKWQIPNAAQKQVGEIHQKWGKYTPKYASCLEDSKDWFYVHILSLIQLLNQAHAIFKLWGPCFIVKTKQNKLLGAVKTLVQICPS